MNCTCKGYAFPHRPKSGKCLDDGIGPFCGECGHPCETVERDYGYGAYEFWGATGCHSNVQTVSACCEADVFRDASLETLCEFAD